MDIETMALNAKRETTVDVAASAMVDVKALILLTFSIWDVAMNIARHEKEQD